MMFEVSLSDADIELLFEKAYSNGITPEKLIADYIGDLVGGTYTHGSDERDLAERYFERCNYDFIPKSLLHWALNEERFDQLKDAVEALDFLEEDKKTMPPQEYENEKQSFRDAEDSIKADIAEIYADYSNYKKRMEEEPQELKPGLEDVWKYIKQLEGAKSKGSALYKVPDGQKDVPPELLDKNETLKEHSVAKKKKSKSR